MKTYPKTIKYASERSGRPRKRKFHGNQFLNVSSSDDGEANTSRSEQKLAFKGIIATAFTPFKSDSAKSLNLSIIPQYAEYYANKGYEAVLINGTYGEGMAMTVAERMQVAESWSKAVKKTKQQLIVQVGGTNLQDVKKLASHAQAINANAILNLPELYYKPKTVEELIDYLKEVGDAAPKVPLFYYHSPEATGVKLSMVEFFKKVGNTIPTLNGIKFADTNIDECTKIIHAAGDSFKIIVANNNILPACIVLGIDTFMPTVINVAPDIVNEIYKLATNGDYATAQKYQNELAKIVQALAEINNGEPLSPMKAIMSIVTAIKVGPTRQPLQTFETSDERITLLVKQMF